MLLSYANLTFMRGLIAVIVALVALAVHPVTPKAQDRDTAFRNGLSAFQTGSYDRARSVWAMPIASFNVRPVLTDASAGRNRWSAQVRCDAISVRCSGCDW